MRDYFSTAFIFIAYFIFVALIVILVTWVISSCGFWHTMMMGDRALLGVLTGSCT